MTVAALVQSSISLKDLRRQVDASIDTAQNSDAAAAPHAWSVAADHYVLLAKAELEAFNAKSSHGLGYTLGFRDRVEQLGLIVTQSIAAAIGQLGESTELVGKHTAASEALLAYENRGDR